MTTEELNKRIAIFYRAEQIAKEYRIKFGMSERKQMYNSSLPEFQGELDSAHCFNKYIKELRTRYA